MLVNFFSLGPIETNSVLLIEEESRKGWIFDVPPGAVSHIKQFFPDVTIEKIFLTHSHWDHLADLAQLVDETNANVFVHREDADNVRVPGSDGMRIFPQTRGVTQITELGGGEEFSFFGKKMQVLHTPGHSKGSVCFFFPEEMLLIAGDTLFKQSHGRLDLPTSIPEKMGPSLESLAKLPKNTRVLTGHGEETSIGDEEWLERASELIS